MPELDPDPGIKSSQAREGSGDILRVIYIVYIISMVAYPLLSIANSQHPESCMLLPIYMKDFSAFLTVTHSKGCLL